VSLVLDLRIDHDRFGSNSDLNLNTHLHYPNSVDKSPNETVVLSLTRSESIELTTILMITPLTLSPL
jgi:hypothetical protein